MFYVVQGKKNIIIRGKNTSPEFFCYIIWAKLGYICNDMGMVVISP